MSLRGIVAWLPNLISLARLLAVPVTIYLLLRGFNSWAFWLFGARDEVLSMALTYGTIMFAATPLMFSTFTLKGKDTEGQAFCGEQKVKIIARGPEPSAPGKGVK